MGYYVGGNAAARARVKPMPRPSDATDLLNLTIPAASDRVRLFLSPGEDGGNGGAVTADTGTDAGDASSAPSDDASDAASDASDASEAGSDDINYDEIIQRLIDEDGQDAADDAQRQQTQPKPEDDGFKSAVTAEQLSKLRETNPELADVVEAQARDLAAIEARVRQAIEKAIGPVAQTVQAQRQAVEAQRARDAQKAVSSFVDKLAKSGFADVYGEPGKRTEAHNRQLRELVARASKIQERLGVADQEALKIAHELKFRDRVAQTKKRSAAITPVSLRGGTGTREETPEQKEAAAIRRFMQARNG